MKIGVISSVIHINQENIPESRSMKVKKTIFMCVFITPFRANLVNWHPVKEKPVSLSRKDKTVLFLFEVWTLFPVHVDFTAFCSFFCFWK